MRVTLTCQLEALISDHVTSGLYKSNSEVVREALRSFFHAEQVRALTLKQFERAIDHTLIRSPGAADFFTSTCGGRDNELESPPRVAEQGIIF